MLKICKISDFRLKISELNSTLYWTM